MVLYVLVCAVTCLICRYIPVHTPSTLLEMQFNNMSSVPCRALAYHDSTAVSCASIATTDLQLCHMLVIPDVCPLAGSRVSVDTRGRGHSDLQMHPWQHFLSHHIAQLLLDFIFREFAGDCDVELCFILVTPVNVYLQKPPTIPARMFRVLLSRGRTEDSRTAPILNLTLTTAVNEHV